MSRTGTARRLLIVAAFALLLGGVAEVGLWFADALAHSSGEGLFDRFFGMVYVTPLVPTLIGATLALIARVPRRLGVVAAVLAAISAATSLVAGAWTIRVVVRESIGSAIALAHPLQTITFGLAGLALAAALLRASQAGTVA